VSWDPEACAAAIKAAIAAQMPAGVPVYEVDEVPGSAGGPSGTAPAKYVTFELGRRWHPEKRGDADMIPGGSLTTHYRAANVSDVRNLLERVQTALENRAYNLPGGDTVGPFSFQFDEEPDYVAEGWSAFVIWNF
jgi:hypothetical protein